MADLISIITDIQRGYADKDLDAIVLVVEERKRFLGTATFNTIKVGDKVRLTDGRPTYLTGATATVVGKNKTRVVIEIDEVWLNAHPQAKPRWQGRITTPTELLELIN